ncbi:MAG: CAP domain-containing protein [Patescibacteria group bacterium]
MNTTSSTKKPLHHRIAHHAKHWFIPHEGNDHKPHALRPQALRAYAYVLITAKVASVIFLFAAFPNRAEFAAYTSSTIVALTNASRQERKLEVLRANPLLDQAAQRKAKDMLARNYFAHTTPDGKRFWTWIDGTGYNYSLAGENLAIDFSTPEAAHSALLASPTHKENIMNTRYKEIGVAVVTGTMDGQETTVLVEMFGTQVAKKTTVAKVTTVKPKVTTPKPKPVIKPSPKPQVRAEETPTPTGLLTQQSADTLSVPPNSSVDVWAEFRNTGTQTWKTGNFSLVTVEPTKHDSPIRHSNWESASIVAALSEDVAPQTIVRFEWKVQSPVTLGTVTERFALIDTEGTVLPKTTVTIGISAQEPTALATTLPPTQTDVSNPAATSQPEQVAAPTVSRAHDLTSRVIAFTDRFYLAFLFFLLLALGMNIFIKIRIQHAHVISQTAIVIAIAATGLFLKFHFLQNLGQVVKVLGQ